MDAFEKLINFLPPNLSVLDVGAFGLEGENTSTLLKGRFTDCTGINIKPLADIVGDYKTYKFGTQFDLVVLDLNIENNLLDWSSEGLGKISRLVKPGGHIISYIMTTTEYGNPDETPIQIAIHRDLWWGGFENVGKKLTELEGWKFVIHQTEERRPYITWVMLEKIHGF